MIGNDIIDLRVSGARERASDPRFLNKLFTKKEEKIIKTSVNPGICLWRLWSMKEAVYKAHQRRFALPRKFNPKAFKCSVFSDIKGMVVIENIPYHTQTELTSEYIHSKTGKPEFFQKVYSDGKIQKNRILNDLASEFTVQAHLINFEKDHNGIPWISIENYIKKHPISLSHHGSFTGFIIPLINS